MKRFKLWVEDKEFDKNKDFFISYLDLDKNQGLSMALDTFNKKSLLRKIKDSNFYDELSDIAKDSLEKVILSNNQTVGDLVRAVS
jgi:hypothetical protein